MPTDKQFVDIMLRHQVYLENYKTRQASTYIPVLSVLSSIIRQALNNLNVTTLNELPKKDLNKLVSNINSQQKPVIDQYVNEQLKQAEELTKKELSLFQRVLNFTPSASLQNGIIRAVNNDPIGATGDLTKAFLTYFGVRVATGIIDRIRKGYANGYTIPEMIRELIGSPFLRFRDGFLNRTKNWNKAVIDTTIQHASSVAVRDITKSFFERYLWVSVIDDVTTDICRARNNNVYVYGEGPIPPAHINCRSTIVPIKSGSLKLPRYQAWLDEQSSEFLNDIDEPITLDDFGDKVGIIIGEDEDA